MHPAVIEANRRKAERIAALGRKCHWCGDDTYTHYVGKDRVVACINESSCAIRCKSLPEYLAWPRNELIARLMGYG